MIALTARSPKSTQIFCAAMFLISILGYFGETAGVFAAEAHQPFAAFNANVEIDIEDGEIDMTATFTLGAGNNGVDPAKENVSLQVTGGTGACSLTIPAGSFKADRGGEFKFQRNIDGVKVNSSDPTGARRLRVRGGDQEGRTRRDESRAFLLLL